MIKRICWVLAFVAVVLAIALLTGCAARTPQTHAATVVVHQQRLQITLHNLHAQAISSVMVDNFPADGWTLSPNGQDLMIEFRCHGRELEEGQVTIAWMDSGGHAFGAVVPLPSGGRFKK